MKRYYYDIHIKQRNPIEDIIDRVCEKMQIRKELLINGNRDEQKSLARKFIVAIARLNLQVSTTKIGEKLNRDHSTISTAWKKTIETPWIQNEFYKYFPEEMPKLKRAIRLYNIEKEKQHD